MDPTPKMRAVLEAQRAYFASDDRIRDRAALWVDATPVECLAAVHEACEQAAYFLSQMDDETRERALASDPLPPETEALLMRLWSCRAR